VQTLSDLSRLSSKPIQDFVTEATVVSTEDPVSEIIGKIASKRLYEVFVQHDSGFGVVTLRNILRAGELSQTRLSSLAVTSPAIMSTDPVSKAARFMSGLRVRSLPVTDHKGKLMGALLSATILRELVKTGSSGGSVADVMTPRPITVDFSDSLDKALSLMVENDIDHLPVTRDGKLTGVITSLDIASVMGPSDRTDRMSKRPEPSSRGSVKVGGIMRDEPITCKPTDDSFLVLKNILDKERTGATVMLGGTIQGIVTLRDYVKLLTVQPESGGPPVYVVGLPEQGFESLEAESKFRRSVEALNHVYAINEARATVKASPKGRERSRFEVSVLIRSPGEQFDFAEDGWSIEEVFEKIGEKMKRLMTKPRDSRSRQRHPSRGEAESERYAE
jgi:CBS domain-containing protein